nr:MAG TPA: Cell cycle protein [Caudoviricetes sp.]
MDDYRNLSREEVHAFLEQSLAELDELRGEHAGDEETIGEIDHGIGCLRYLQEIMGMLDMIMEMPLSAAGPVGLVTIWSLAAVIAGVEQMARRRKEKEKNDGRL